MVAAVEKCGIAHRVVAVGEEQVRGEVRVVGIHRLARFAQAHVVHAGVLVDGRKIGAAHGAVLIEQQLRAVNLSVIVALLRRLQIADGRVDAVVLLVQQRGIQPRCRVIRIKPARQLKVLFRKSVVVLVGKGLAEIAPQQRALRLERGRDL